jgi:hypothetical protein
VLWDDAVRKAAAHWGREYGVTIDPALVHAIIERESAHGQAPNYIRNRGIVPESGGHVSYGPMQIYDDTARTVLKLTFPFEGLASHPDLGIWYGVKYFASLLQRFKGDVERAVSGYNAGPGNAVRSSATGQFPNQSYVDFVKGFWQRHRGQVVSLVPVLVLAGVVWFLSSRRARRAAA